MNIIIDEKVQTYFDNHCPSDKDGNKLCTLAVNEYNPETGVYTGVLASTDDFERFSVDFNTNTFRGDALTQPIFVHSLFDATNKVLTHVQGFFSRVLGSKNLHVKC